ncbi:MAG TPA: dihydrofolate reductase family protein [Polyangiales bacterium]|nr:dihydrofolate reductase family protein [Polyangiales bacterium]
MEGQVPEVASWLRSLYGTTSFATRGVLHVTSIAPSQHVIAIGPGAPKSEGDFFVLNLARARADAVLTTGSIVRLEGAYHLALQGPHAPALERYRSDVLGKPRPPLCAIMTRDGRLPRLHPLWNDGTEKVVLTTPEHAEALERELDVSATVLAVAELDARRAVEVLRARGAELISIEAGPGANAALYEPPALVDELSLSIYEGPPVQLGAALTARLLDGMTLASETVREEESGRWRYQRWLR